MRVPTYIKEMRIWTMFIFASVVMNSCDSILDNPAEDCSVDYRVKFKYDYNMSHGDAFAYAVKSITLYAFDADGKLAFQRTEAGDPLGEDGYSMLVDVAPGDYDLLAWGGLEGEESFAVPLLHPGESTLKDLTCAMQRNYGTHRSGNGTATAYVDKDLRPLFHGQLKKQAFTRAAFTQTVTVPLMKNTNNVRIMLAHLSNEPVDVNKYTFTIEDENGLMNYDNSLLKDEKLTYYAWRTDKGEAEVKTDSRSSRAATPINTAVAELTVGRLVMENKPILRISDEVGKDVLSIPLIDYALMVKGHYNESMPDQEYLDRQDVYEMTFFLDKNENWLSSTIIINGWKIVRDDVTVGE